MEGGIWKTSIFGKTVEELVMDGMKNKMAVINDESQEKLQDTMQKVVNDSNGGMVCTIIQNYDLKFKKHLKYRIECVYNMNQELVKGPYSSGCGLFFLP